MSKKTTEGSGFTEEVKNNLDEVIELSLKMEPKPTSRRTKATLLVMLSYDYNHFEASIELTGEDIPLADIDNARKDCQRLCDKAVGQYKTAKSESVKRTNNSYERMQLETEVGEINKIKEEFLTPDEKAKVKAWNDYKHQCRYDYDDDDLYPYKNH